MEDLSLHVLDVAENAVAAGAKRVDIRIEQEEENDLLVIEIQDDGKGMDAEDLKRAADPFYTTKTGKRIGLGLSLLTQAAREADGTMEIKSQPGSGTLVRATFKESHIDRRPLGNMADTLSALVAGNPGVRFTYTYTSGETRLSMDTADIDATPLSGNNGCQIASR